MNDYYDLGRYSRTVSTSSSQAQKWCDLGLIWCYAFNHDEAVTCFKRAIQHDHNCVFAYWGVSYALGCNYNKAWSSFDPEDAARSLAQAFDYVEEADRRQAHASDVEKALVVALHRRYQARDVPSVDQFAKWNADYSNAMREVYTLFPHDLDVATLFSESIMNLTPWQMWDLRTGKIPEGAGTAEAMEVLERGLRHAQGYQHPGLLHMYLHLMEMSPTPERALKAADALRSLVPDAGHLIHMPTHIDLLCGFYERAVTSNHRAIIADRKYLAREGANNFYTLYRCHNYHFKVYSAMFLGQCRTAIETADELMEALPKDLLEIKSPPMADWLEGFVSVKQHVLIRFGKWTEIIAQGLPEDANLFCVTAAMIRYAKAVAFAASGNIKQAEFHAASFEKAFLNVPETRMLFNNTCRDILSVGRQMMLGEIEYRKGNFDNAFSHLRKSVDMDDQLPYDEPWGWMQPTRHALAALLLEQGRVEEAAEVYKADLGLDPILPRALQHPDNIWSLRGYHDCLSKLGRASEAALVQQRLLLASARADVAIKSSCFCKQGSL